MESRDSEDFKNGIKFDNRIIFDHAFDHFHGRFFHRRAFPKAPNPSASGKFFKIDFSGT